MRKHHRLLVRAAGNGDFSETWIVLQNLRLNQYREPMLSSKAKAAMGDTAQGSPTKKKAEQREIQAIPSVQHFLFNAPLYATHAVTHDHVSIMYGRAREHFGDRPSVIDGYCPQCKRDSTFEIDHIHIPSGDPWNNIATRYAYDDLSVVCARNPAHKIRYNLLVRNMTVTKIGQYPSLADVAIDEARQKYRTVLKGENWGELYKAIGLAAHGEGIGSFVYLRRVFERLIQSRFDEYKDQEGWEESAFKSMRMDEKIALLENHLPRLLVETRKIYKIFSLGIHELNNQTCLQFFEVGKRSIIMILDDDLKTQKDLADRKQLTEAVAKFEIDSTDNDDSA